MEGSNRLNAFVLEAQSGRRKGDLPIKYDNIKK
jgi:hypothetical protein